jgi:hypothetical protein
MRRLISGELTDYSVVRTSPEPLHKDMTPCQLLILYVRLV